MTKETSEITRNQAPEQKVTFVPNTDIYKEDKGWYIVADLPGVSENDVDVTIEKNKINISGASAVPSIQEGYKILHSEYYNGNYERSFLIPEDVDDDKIEASMKDGVLKLFLPYAQKKQPKKINIHQA